jgi:hypothetical protein
MDRITQNQLNEFIREFCLESLPEDEAFEYFTGYLITLNHFQESFSIDDIHVGSGGDLGIDSIAIIVNGNIVSNPEEIEDIADNSSYLDVVI